MKYILTKKFCVLSIISYTKTTNDDGTIIFEQLEYNIVCIFDGNDIIAILRIPLI